MALSLIDSESRVPIPTRYADLETHIMRNKLKNETMQSGVNSAKSDENIGFCGAYNAQKRIIGGEQNVKPCNIRVAVKGENC